MQLLTNAITRSAATASRALAFLKAVIRPIFFYCVVLCTVLMMGAASGDAGDFNNALSLQGFTGLLNTPNAEVTDDGKFSTLYSNQIEQQSRSTTPREDNYIFSVGLLPFLELGGRLTDKTGPGSDLSANVKIKIPVFPSGRSLPVVAFGMQDVGGGDKYLQTKYLVASEEFWRIRLSLGAGTGPDRMKGVFGGAEIKAFDWLYLIGENDTKETNVGGRLVASNLFGYPINLQITAKTSLDSQRRNTGLGFGLQFPLGNDRHNRTPAPVPPDKRTPPAPEAKPETGPAPGQPPELAAEPSSAPSGTKGTQPAGSNADAKLQRLLEKLTAEGFQNVKVGTKEGALLVVEYENNRYNYNELDGLGAVIGIVADTMSTGDETLRLITKKQGIRMLELSAPLEDFRAFLHDPGKYEELNGHLKITTDVEDDGGVSFIAGPGNPSWLSSSLVVYPGLKTFVGTEVGAFDYLLSAKLDYYLNTWKGAVVNARWDVPAAWSENFDEDKAFRNNRAGSRLERLMLFQALKAAPDVMFNIGGGMIVHDSYGTLNEIMWTPGDGTHRFLFRQAYASNRDSDAVPQRHEVYLGSYRYYFSPLDLAIEGTGGRFFDNDQGFRVTMKRFFGDTSFSAYYANSVTTSREHVQVGGVMIAFPLTLRRDMKPGPVQLKGSNEWSYSQETKIVASGGANTVATSIGVDPKPAYNLERVFYNRDRLSESYIRKHLLRLRDAYITYQQKEP